AFAAYDRLRRARVEKLVAASAGNDVGAERGWAYRHHLDWSARITA
ncbi:FAD-dependent monooxygenase, partial [Amycolatopsis sp. NPDC000673]